MIVDDPDGYRAFPLPFETVGALEVAAGEDDMAAERARLGEGLLIML